MPDITMCTNIMCPLKCVRKDAEPSPYRQSYSHFIYHELDDGSVDCWYHIPINEWEQLDLFSDL